MPAANATITATYQSTATGSGLRGQYYNDSSSAPYPLANPFAGSPVLTRTDATVDFNWSGGSPGSPVTSNFFSAKWTGRVRAPVSGAYTFRVTGDDGVRLFINGTKVIDGWRDQGATPYTYSATLSAGAFSALSCTTMSTKATLPVGWSGAIPDKRSKLFRRATCSHRRFREPRRPNQQRHFIA